MAESTAMAEFQCRFCQSTFARHEHLSRHIRSHTREKPFRCVECAKSFSRQDVLARHTASHVPNPSASSRACAECAAGRVRCSKESPCKRCADRSLECIYPPSSRKRKASSAEQGDGMESATREADEDTSDTGQRRQVVRPTVGDVRPERRGSGSNLTEQMPDEAMRVFPQPSPCAHEADPVKIAHSLERAPQEYSSAVNQASDDQVPGLSSINWLSPYDSDSIPWNGELAGFSLDGEWFGNLALPFPLDNLGTIDNTAWTSITAADEEPPVVPAVDSRRMNGSGLMAAADRTPESSQSTVSSTISSSTVGLLYVEGAASRAPFRGRLIRRPSTLETASPLMRSGGDNGTTPVSETAAAVDASRKFVSAIAYENMCKGIQNEADILGLDIDPPSLMHVRRFVCLYFQELHPTFPFLRQSLSLLERPENWLLLLSISAIGARYSSETLSNSLTPLVDKILDRHTPSTRPSDPHGLWVPGRVEPEAGTHLAVVQAEVLNVIDMLHSGEKKLMERAFSRHYRLVERCRRMNLLSRTWPGISPTAYTRDEEIISAWLDAQSEIRTGMMVWLLDSILGYQFNRPHLLLLNDAESPLPSPEFLWSDPTAERISNAVSETEALELLHMEKRLPPHLSEFSNLLLIFAVCRRTKEAAYQHQTGLSRWTPSARFQTCTASQPIAESWPPSLPILASWRNSACDCLDILHWNANGTAARAGGYEHPTILFLHLSRLLLLVPINHVQSLAASLSSSGPAVGGSWGTSNPKAWHHLRRWAVLDQFKARLSMVHAGALLWHIRRYSTNGFLEPFSIYVAALALWAYSVASQQQGNQGTGSAVPFVADQLSPGSLDMNSEQDEEPEPEFIHLDRPCDDEMVQLYVRVGHKMAGYVRGVGDILSSGAPQRILKEGARLLSKHALGSLAVEISRAGQEAPGIWGIQKSYAESLRCLIKATTSQGGMELG
ncbi:hypothetical protein ACJZ2D_000284 [Fusarium nematophilum]